MSDMRFDLPVSGLQANSVRASVSANNMVNFRSLDSAARPDVVPFQPAVVESVAQPSGGVKTTVRRENAYNDVGGGPVPQSLSGGLLAVGVGSVETGVSPVRETVNLRVAARAYDANVAVFGVLDEMAQTLLDDQDKNRQDV